MQRVYYWAVITQAVAAVVLTIEATGMEPPLSYLLAMVYGGFFRSYREMLVEHWNRCGTITPPCETQT